MGGSGSDKESLLPAPLIPLMVLDRVTLDTSILVGPRSLEFAIAARLRYYRGHWSSWIVAEFSRVRTEMILRRARRELGITFDNEAEGAIQEELEQRLLNSRARVNAAIDDFSRVLASVDYQRAEGADLAWLEDQDDHPIMQTAIAAGVPGVLVTDDRRDFPTGEARNGILIVSGIMFLDYLYRTYPEAEAVITSYAESRRQAMRDGA